MTTPAMQPLRWLGQRAPHMTLREIVPGVLQVRLQTWVMSRIHFIATPYLVRETLIDTGSSHLGPVLLPWLASQRIHDIALTHHHEDHSGNAGPIAQARSCPVWLTRPDLFQTEGVADIPFYRRLFWGRPHTYDPRPMPPHLLGGDLVALPTPGHSATHTVFFLTTERILFSGDLLISLGASATMRYEDPDALVRSLHAAADLEPRLVCTGHGHIHERGADRLRTKADRVEAAILTVRSLHASGRPAHSIVKEVFPRGILEDEQLRVLTGGEFSRRCFVDAVLRNT